MEEPSLRERKKARVRAELIEVSQRLFLERGYDETTLEQICNEVEVAPQTLLRYFESKQQLAIAPLYDGLARLEDELAGMRASGIAVHDVWRQHVVRNARGAGARNARRINEFIYRTPVLLAAASSVFDEYERVLAVALAEEAGVDPATDLHSKLLAILLVAGNSRAFVEHLESSSGSLVDRLEATTTYVLTHFLREP